MSGHGGDEARSPGAALQVPGIGVPQGITQGGDRWGQATIPRASWGSGAGVPSPLGCGNWALKVLAVLRGAGFVGARAQVHTSQYLPGPLRSPHSHRGVEVGAGGAMFAPHPHPRLPPDTAADATRRRHLRQRKLPLLRAGDKSRLLLRPFPPCPPPRGALLPPSLLALGTWLPLVCPFWGTHTAGWARVGVLPSSHGWALGAGGMLQGCSRDTRGMLGLPSGKARHPPGVTDPQWLHQLRPLEAEGLISDVRGWWDQSCHLLWG